MAMSKRLYTDILTLIKKDSGERIEDIYAIVGNDGITTYNADFDLDPGDIFLRTRPSGSQEQYRVLSPGFTQRFGGIQAHYSARVEFIGALKKDSNTQIGKVVISGDNARLNINSLDNSSNVVVSGQFDTQLLEGLLRAVQEIPNKNERADILNNIQRMSDTANDRNAFLESYNAFIASAANHMTVFLPFIPTLTKLLSGL